MCLLLFREDFIDDVRKVLGVPEWMLTYDNRQTKDVQEGECIQLLFHFRGLYLQLIIEKLIIIFQLLEYQE